jgi:hypothetical protein
LNELGKFFGKIWKELGKFFDYFIHPLIKAPLHYCNRLISFCLKSFYKFWSTILEIIDNTVFVATKWIFDNLEKYFFKPIRDNICHLIDWAR